MDGGLEMYEDKRKSGSKVTSTWAHHSRARILVVRDVQEVLISLVGRSMLHWSAEMLLSTWMHNNTTVCAQSNPSRAAA